MNGSSIGEREQTVVTRLRVGDGPLLRPVLCRVVSMVLTRADWPLDQLEEALLVCDALCARAPEQGGDGTSPDRPTYSVQADGNRAELCVSQLAAADAQRLLGDHLPLVGNVLEQLADSVAVEQEQDGARLRIALSCG